MSVVIVIRTQFICTLLSNIIGSSRIRFVSKKYVLLARINLPALLLLPWHVRLSAVGAVKEMQRDLQCGFTVKKPASGDSIPHGKIQCRPPHATSSAGVG